MRRISWLVVVGALVSSAAWPMAATAQIGKLKKKAESLVPKTPKTPVGDSAAADSTPPAEGAGPAAEERPGEGAWVNFDFQPGERPLYVDDFSKDVVGNFPQRLTFVGGNMEIAEWKGARYLRTTSRDARFLIPLPERLPERFTIEFDANASRNNTWNVLTFGSTPVSHVTYRHFNDKGQGGIGGTGPQALGVTRTPLGSGLFRIRIMADGKYVKVYLDETRVANVPNADLGRSDTIAVAFSGTEDDPVFIGNFSVMAGGRKLYDALAESGRVATHGIYFDTGSDRIRPESTPTLVEIAQMLKEHDELALLIEGHTDDVGSAATNQSLSERRAAAVRQFLVGEHHVAEARLTTAGFGASKPAAPNTTAEGRQTNRRVELVKQ